LIEKIEISHKFAWKNRNFTEICLDKSKFFDPDTRHSQISNQIDDTDAFWSVKGATLKCRLTTSISYRRKWRQ